MGIEPTNSELPIIIYRLDLYEKRLQGLENKVTLLSEGFIGVKSELSNVAKNEGKISGAISGVITGVLVAILGIVFQAITKIGG